MFYNKNPYTLQIEESDGKTRYIVFFKDGQGIIQEIEVPRQIYHEFDEFRKHDKRQQNYFDLHIEHFDLTDKQINRRALRQSKGLEETVIDRMRNEAMKQAIAELPEIQRRRFTLYYEHDLNYREIGEMEGCTESSVQKSVKLAKEKLRANLKKFK